LERHFFIDPECLQDIKKLLEDQKFKKKLNYIVDRILNLNIRYYEDYVKLITFNSLTEIRLFPNGMNARIYCKEGYTEEGTLLIIASKFLEKKKANKIAKEIQNRLRIIEKYEYEIIN
jgi:hypothetical protein